MTVADLFAGEPALVPGALRGYRRWRWSTSQGQLLSTGMQHLWRQRPFGGTPEVASCLGYSRCDRPVPNAAHSCGIYGWYDPADSRIPLSGAEGGIFGVVQATGRVVLGSHGFRAERVAVVAVACEDAGVRRVLDEHGFEVFDSEAQLVAAYPAEDVSGLVQHECDGQCVQQTAAGGLFVVVGPVHWTHVYQSVAVSSAQAAQSLHDAWRRITQQSAAAVWQAYSQRILAGANISPQQVQAALDAADGITSAPTDGPVHGPLTPAQTALEARRKRNTGPGGGSLFRQVLRGGR